MTPRYIIHIGPLKTASTYVQECLTAARADLERQGICYPAELLDENASFMHMPVYRALARNQAEALRPVFARLNAAGHHTILLSCEHLIYLRAEAFAALRDVTGASDIKIVYTCRRWSDRLSSIWNQTLFMGATHSLPEFYLSMLAPKPTFQHPKKLREVDPASDLDYSITWRMLEGVFGRHALEIFPYSAIMDRGADLFDAFCQDVLGLAAAPKTQITGTRRWASLPTEDQEVLRMLNQLHLDTHAKPTDEVRAQFMRRRKQYDTMRIVEAMKPYTTHMEIDDANILFDEAFNNMNAYADRVVGGDILFERKQKMAKYVQPGYLLRDGVREDIHKIFAQIGTDLAAFKNRAA